MCMSIVWTINLALPCMLKTHSRVIASCLAVQDVRNSTVTKLMPLDKVTKNGKQFTHITSATSGTYLCMWIKSFGIWTYSVWTCSRFVLVVLPQRLARSGPKIRFALLMSCTVTGQLVRSFSCTNLANNLSIGFQSSPEVFLLPWLSRLNTWCILQNPHKQYSQIWVQYLSHDQSHLVSAT